MIIAIDDTTINIFLSDICNFQLVIFGISITIFTVLYSFILSKREDLKNTNDQIKNGDVSPILRQKISFYNSYIKRWKRINNHVIKLSIISFIIYFVGYVIKQFSINTVKSCIFYGVSLVTILIIFYIIDLLHKSGL